MEFAIIFIFLQSLSLFSCIKSGIFSSFLVFQIYSLLGVSLSYILAISDSTINATISEESLLILLLALFCVYSSYQIFSLFHKTKIINISSSKFVNISIRRRSLFFLLLLLISSFLFTANLQSFSQSFARVSNDNSTSLPYLLLLSSFSSAFTILLFASIQESNNRLNRNLSLAAIILFLSNSFLSGGRSIFLFNLIAVGYISREIRIFAAKNKFVFFACCSLSLVLISGFTIFLRYREQGARSLFDLSLASAFYQGLTGLSYLEQFDIAKYISDNNLIRDDFLDFLANLASQFVPRYLWPDKPIQLSRVVRGVLFSDEAGGIPLGFFGELFLYGKIPLVIFGSFCYGFVINAIDTWIMSPRYSFLSKSRAAIASPLFGYAFIRGGLDISMFRVLMPLVLYVLAESFVASQIVRLPQNITQRSFHR